MWSNKKQAYDDGFDDGLTVAIGVGMVGAVSIGSLHVIGSVLGWWSADYVTWWITLACMILVNLAMLLTALTGDEIHA